MSCYYHFTCCRQKGCKFFLRFPSIFNSFTAFALLAKFSSQSKIPSNSDWWLDGHLLFYQRNPDSFACKLALFFKLNIELCFNFLRNDRLELAEHHEKENLLEINIFIRAPNQTGKSYPLSNAFWPELAPFGPPMWQAEADTEFTMSGSPTTAVGQKALALAKRRYFTVNGISKIIR